MSDFKLDFVGIGFPRCGTTWISKCLAEHPEISFTRDKKGDLAKETHFFCFDHEYKKGFAWYEDEYFSGRKPGNICGEFTTIYFAKEKTLERIKQAFPDTKIIVSLRNPYDRAFSHFLYRKRKNGKPKDFSEVFGNDEHHIIKWSDYFPYVEMLLKHFDRDKILFVFHDESRDDPYTFIQNIYRFLDVSDDFRPTLASTEVNRSKDLRYYVPQFQWLLSLRYKVRRYTLGRNFISLLKLTGLNRLVLFLRDVNHMKPAEADTEFLSVVDRDRLKVLYLPNIKKLEQLLDKDLSAWKE